MFAEDQPFAFADDVFMLRCQGDVAAGASAVFDRNDDAVFFVVQEPLVDAHDFWIGRSLASRHRLNCSLPS